MASISAQVTTTTTTPTREEQKEEEAPLTTTLLSGATVPVLGRQSHYDVLVLGTGLTECCLAGLLSSRGKQVLMLDRNNYYGGASASLNLADLYQKFKPNTSTIPNELKQYDVNEFQCDLTPKFIMSDGTLVKIIRTTDATRYLDFMPVEGSFCVRNSKFHKVPATANEALKTSLVGFFQKRYMKNLLKYVVQCDLSTENTNDYHKLMNITSKELIMDEHWCSENTTEFIGHCIALHQDNLYLNQPAIHTVHNMRKYAKSLAKYDEGNSPFIYPEYGLGGLSEAFARICSINGGDFILGRDIHDNDFIVNNTGNEKKIQVSCINSETKIIEGCTVNAIVGDPSYFNDNKRMQQGSIIRCICLLRGRVEGLPDENVQIIYPQGQCIPKRQNDIYISIIGSSFKCTPDNSNIWCATMSTIIENQNNPFSELSNAMKLVGGDANIIDSFYEVTPYYVPLEDDENDDNIYVSKSVDATTHFESITLDVISLYERITGEKLQFDKDGSEEKEGNGETKK